MNAAIPWLSRILAFKFKIDSAFLGKERFTFESSELHHHNLITIFTETSWIWLVCTFILNPPPGLQVKTVGNFLKRRYCPLKMGQRCVLSVHLLLFSFESVLMLLTNISHHKPYKLDLYSWQKTIHSEYVVLSSSSIPPISTTVTSLIFSDKCQLFLLL